MTLSIHAARFADMGLHSPAVVVKRETTISNVSTIHGGPVQIFRRETHVDSSVIMSVNSHPEKAGVGLTEILFWLVRLPVGVICGHSPPHLLKICVSCRRVYPRRAQGECGENSGDLHRK